MTLLAARNAALLFVAFVAIFVSLISLIFAAKTVGLLASAGIALAAGLALLWSISGRETRPLVHAGAALAALLLVAFVPRAIVTTIISRAAATASGGAHCYYQEGNSADALLHAPSVLTRNARDLSLLLMLARRASPLGPPRVTLITTDWTWLWSFRERRFVQWQRIFRGEGPPIIEGAQSIGRPPVAQVARCLDMIENRSVA